jgi:hypothetical protein
LRARGAVRGQQAKAHDHGSDRMTPAQHDCPPIGLGAASILPRSAAELTRGGLRYFCRPLSCPMESTPSDHICGEHP